MKTQRRHELQTNWLADHLGKQLEAVKPYSKMIAGVLIGLLAVGIAVNVITRRQSADVGRGWSAYFGAMSDPEPGEALNKVAKDYVGTSAGLWALQSAADSQVSEASMEMFRDPAAARELLKKAKDNYAAVEQAAVREPMLRQRAVFGLAQVHESLGELDAARTKYEELAKQAPDTAIGKAATRRLAQLVDASTGKLRPEIETFYEELAEHKPLPPVIPRDPSSTFGDGFENPTFDLDSLPDRPNISFPGSGVTTPPATTDKTEPEAVPSANEPKPDNGEPVSSSPAPAASEDKPAAEKSKDSADENPTAETPSPKTDDEK